MAERKFQLMQYKKATGAYEKTFSVVGTCAACLNVPEKITYKFVDASSVPRERGEAFDLHATSEHAIRQLPKLGEYLRANRRVGQMVLPSGDTVHLLSVVNSSRSATLRCAIAFKVDHRPPARTVTSAPPARVPRSSSPHRVLGQEACGSSGAAGQGTGEAATHAGQLAATVEVQTSPSALAPSPGQVQAAMPVPPALHPSVMPSVAEDPLMSVPAAPVAAVAEAAVTEAAVAEAAVTEAAVAEVAVTGAAVTTHAPVLYVLNRAEKHVAKVKLDDAREWTIGRASDCELTVKGSALEYEPPKGKVAKDTVSRHHARLLLANGQIEIEDLSSTQGTFCAHAALPSDRAPPTPLLARCGLHVLNPCPTPERVLT